MCGINGVFHYKNSKTVDKSVLEKARDTLAHRGPDGVGLYISPRKKLGFGHRRLAIIDLSDAGKQPMTNEDGSIWVTYNGEIYNFQTIKGDLEKRGHTFRSHTDTEVITHAYEEYGPECVKKFNGMFAFALWDEKNNTLFAARDHVGIKPFFYTTKDGSFYFGSEIKAILAHSEVPKELNEQGVSHYLTFATSPEPDTLFRGIHKLPAGHTLLIRENEDPVIQSFWNPVQPEQPEVSEDEYIERVRELLKSSIRSQMVSDVPFGCFLSGGIDSSTNAALMSEVLGHPVETFSVGAKKHRQYNEFNYSRSMAERLGAKQHEILIDDSHLFDFLPKFGHIADDPNGDQVCVPLYWLSKLTRDSGVLMVQIGEGSDELFLGYDTYLKAYNLYQKIWRFLEYLPSWKKRMIFNMSDHVLTHPRFDFQKGYLLRLARGQDPYWGNAVAFSDYQKEKLTTTDFQGRISVSGYPIIERYYDAMKNIEPNAGFLRKLFFLELKHRLPELLLSRADKMTMAHSVEGRVPFLDNRLVELAFQIPGKLKIKNNTEKYLLKKAVEGIIPPEIIYRKKQGFATPMTEWFQEGTLSAKRLMETILSSKLKERNILNYEYLDYLFRSHQKKEVNHNFRLWNLVTLSLWYDEWFS